MAETNKNMLYRRELFFVIEEKLNSVDIKIKELNWFRAMPKKPNFLSSPCGKEIAEIEKLNIPTRKKWKRKLNIPHFFHSLPKVFKPYSKC
jgi:hypothetical protein